MPSCHTPAWIRALIQTLRSVTPEGHNFVGRQIITRKRHRDDKWLLLEREKKLSAIRVVVHVPQQHLIPRSGLLFGLRLLRISRPAKDVVPFDSVIFSIQHIAAPVAFECAFDPAAFIAGTVINWASVLLRPTGDFNLKTCGVVHQTPIAFD